MSKLNSRYFPMFSIGCGIYIRDDDISENEKSVIEEESFRKNVGNESGINVYVLEDKRFEDLKLFCNNCVNDYVKNLLKKNFSLKITNSWLNKNLTNEYHHFHNHKNSVLSGVFYFTRTKQSPLEIQNPFASHWDSETSEVNEYNRDVYPVPLNKNCLVVFPSELFHSVPKSYDTENRISLAFNTFFDNEQEIGSNQYLTKLTF